MQFVRFTTGSKLYDQELDLRDKILRKPLGLKLKEQDIINDKDELHFAFADDNGEMIACLLIRKINPEVAKLRQMAVDEKLQGRGIGKLLVGKVEDELVKSGYKKIELNSRVYANGFYERLGYEPVGKEFTEVGIPHIKMEKIIK